MKKILLLVLLAAIFCGKGFAQITISGNVYDSVSKVALFPVSIENLQTHKGCFSNDKGEFSLEASLGDAIIFTQVGYNRRIITVKATDDINHLKVWMTIKTSTLKPIIIKRGPTEYQKDSTNRAEIYKSAFEYDQQKSVFTPVTSIYQKFSKKYKNLRKFQDQIVDNEKQKFIDTRYTSELVTQLTKLLEDELASFMNQYPMDYDYARVASDLEIKMWIKYNFQDYVKKGRPAYIPK